MSQSYKIQISPYLADGSMLNIQGDTTEEFAHNLKWVGENAARIASTVSLIKGVGAVAEVLPVAETATLAEAESWARPAQENPTYNAPAVQQYQQVAAQSAPAYAQQAPQAVAPICKHGPMQHKSGVNGSGKAWQGWMCPAPKGAPDQCGPQWLRKGEPGYV